jgi:hypothetical protein
MGLELAMKALVVTLLLGAVAAAGVRPTKMVPAMYVFGDSTLDVGNNKHLSGKDVPRADKPCYGIDLPVLLAIFHFLSDHELSIVTACAY